MILSALYSDYQLKREVSVLIQGVLFLIAVRFVCQVKGGGFIC